MLLIYTEHNTSRLNYIAGVLFSSVLPVQFKVTSVKDNFLIYTGPKINYSNARISDKEIWIKPHPLLFENGIQEQQINCFEWNGLKAFFKTGGDIPFDIFSASFYLISRYEEYLPHTKDEYGRYGHKNSLAFRENFLHLPLVNLWMKEFVKIITHKFPSFTFPLSSFAFIPTYDIDIAYAYKAKSFLRNAGSFYKELFMGKWKQLAERANVYSGWRKDPFDTYEWLDELHEQYHLQPLYFFLVAEKTGIYDKNSSPHSALMKELIKQHASKYSIGIHPSWQSGDAEEILEKEISVLRNITGKDVSISRQHYIRLALPYTYRALLKNNITDDYTMGYGSINGFRASIASSFYWYDLEKDMQTNLLIHPYCYMEANSYFEQHYTEQQAAEELQQYHDVVKAVNGQLITIFHNHFVSEQPQWIAWRNMYADFLKKNFG